MPPESSSTPSKKSLFNLSPDQWKRVGIRHYYLKQAEQWIPCRMAALEYQGYSPEDAQSKAIAEFNAWLKQDRG